MLTSSALTMRSLPLLGGLAVAAGHTNDGDVKYKIEENVLNVKLPKALSDHTATLVGSQVFIAGGCDDLNGNKYNTDSKNFECGSLSQSFYMLDLAAAETADATFVTLPDMPVERYRHAAAASNGQIWIHGGRNLTDHLINEINVRKVAGEAIPAVCAFVLLESWLANDTSLSHASKYFHFTAHNFTASLIFLNLFLGLRH